MTVRLGYLLCSPTMTLRLGCLLCSPTIIKIQLVRFLNTLIPCRKMTFVGNTPRRPRGNPAQHPPMRHVAHQLSTQVPSRGHTALSNPLPGQCSPLFGYVVRTYGRKTQVMLSHFRQPVITRISPPAERKDRNDGKSSPTISNSRLQNDDDSTITSVSS